MRKFIQSLLYSCILQIFIWRNHQCFETTEKRIFLNDDGSLLSSADTPNCRSGTTIDLIGYSYKQIQCHYVDGCHTQHEEPLSPAAEFLLHSLCSGKEECVNLSFPLRSKEQASLTNAVNIIYTCQDRMNFINICVNKVTHFNDTVYLMADEKAILFKECQCFVNKGNFSMTISDLRLTNKNGIGCSSTVLLINSKEYECNGSSGSFGSVFNTNVVRSAVNAFISVTLNSPTVTPDNIVITITAEESAKISCLPKNPSPTSGPKVNLPNGKTQTFWSSTTISPICTTNNKLDKKHSLSEREAYLIAAVVILVALVLAFGLYTANRTYKWATGNCLRFPCVGHAPQKKNTVVSTPEESFKSDTSQLETGTGNSCKTPEAHKLLEEDADALSVEHCQKSMDTFKTVGHTDTSVKHITSSIIPEITDQNETLLPKPELPAQNIGYRRSI